MECYCTSEWITARSPLHESHAYILRRIVPDALASKGIEVPAAMSRARTRGRGTENGLLLKWNKEINLFCHKCGREARPNAKIRNE